MSVSTSLFSSFAHVQTPSVWWCIAWLNFHDLGFRISDVRLAGSNGCSHSVTAKEKPGQSREHLAVFRDEAVARFRHASESGNPLVHTQEHPPRRIHRKQRKARFGTSITPTAWLDELHAPFKPGGAVYGGAEAVFRSL